MQKNLLMVVGALLIGAALLLMFVPTSMTLVECLRPNHNACSDNFLFGVDRIPTWIFLALSTLGISRLVLAVRRSKRQ